MLCPRCQETVAGDGFEFVVKVEDDLPQRQLVREHHAVLAQVMHALLDALLALASGPFPTATMVLSGRRLWQTGELLREAAMLHRRWEAGLHGAFSAEVLAEPQRPPVLVRAATPDEDEPDLAPLHDLMLTRRKEGWRPQMTVREALMHHLALLESIKRT